MIRVLIAEDQAMVRGALASLLALEDDIEVVAEVERGDERARGARGERPDVALLDIEMPGLDGIAAAGALARELPETRVADPHDVRPPGLPASRARGRRRRVPAQGRAGDASSRAAIRDGRRGRRPSIRHWRPPRSPRARAR